MRINHTVEREDGSVTFQANLEGKELVMVVEIGLNYLLQQGALPFLDENSDIVDPALLHAVPDEVQ